MTAFRLVPDVETARHWGEWVVWLSLFVGALVALWRSPLAKPVRWVWAQLVTLPRSRRRAAEIAAAVRPMVDEIKAASKAQHDEQNVILAHHADRLDRGASIMNGMREDIARIEGRLEPRPPGARTRKGDSWPPCGPSYR